MSFLPPMSTDTLESLILIVSDPKKYQAKIDELRKIDSELTQKQKDVAAMADEARNDHKVAELQAKQSAQEFKRMSASAEKALAQYMDSKAQVDLTADALALREKAVSDKEKELLEKTKDINAGHSAVNNMYLAFDKKQEELNKREAALSKAEAELNAKLDKLKALV